MLHIGKMIGAEVSRGRYRLRIHLPRLSCRTEFVLHRVAAIATRKRVIGVDNVAGSHHEVITERRMRVRVELRRQRILRRQSVDERHAAVPDYVAIVLVLHHHNDDVVNGCCCRRRRIAATATIISTAGGASAATGETPKDYCQSKDGLETIHGKERCWGLLQVCL